MNIEILRERRRTIFLKILNSENAILKVPKGLSQKEITEFLDSKKNWLEKSVKKMKSNEDFSKQFDFQRFLYLGGKRVYKKTDVISGFDAFDERRKMRQTKKFYQSFFSRLENYARSISQKIEISFNDIKQISSVRVWGSFDSNKQMKLNFKLVILPERLVEYVIIHELCHSKQMNHSTKFWRLVEKFCPDYKERKKELNQFGFLLKTEL